MSRAVSDTTDDLAEQTAAEARYVYGVVRAGTPVPTDLPAGIAGAGVGLVTHGEVAAVVSTVDPDEPTARRADLVAHSGVLDGLAEHGPVLPVRFGSVLEDEAAVVRDLLAAEHDRLRAMLEDLAGHVQLSVRASYEEELVLAEVVAEHPDVAALRERTRDLPEDASYGDRIRLGELVSAAMESKREADGGALLAAVLPHCAGHRTRDGAGLAHLLEGSFLVHQDRRQAFEAALEGVAEGLHPRARVQLLGPLAPYDYVDL